MEGAIPPAARGVTIGPGAGGPAPRAQGTGFGRGKIAAVSKTQKHKTDRPNPRVEVSGLKPRDDLGALRDEIKF